MSYRAGLSQASRVELVRRTLPSLVHFDYRTLVVPIDIPVRRIKVYLPEVRSLSLRGIELKTEAPLDLARARFSMSPPQKASASPELVLQGKKGVVTQEVPFPFWQVVFRTPQAIQAVVIRNERGAPAIRNVGLCVEFEGADGLSRTFDNTDPDLLLERAEGFAAAVRELCGSGWEAELQDVLAPALARVGESAAALHSGLSEGLKNAAVPDLEALDARRLGLIGEILAVIDATPLGALPRGLAAAAPVLEYLLYRGVDRVNPTGTVEETRAVAVLYADEFLREQGVSNRKLRENARFTQTPERVQMVDHYVSSTYEKVTGDHSLSPIMIRSHGLSGALLHQQSDKYVGSIKEIEGIFNELGYDFAICYGTFLGAVRDKRFIPHDDDVDTAVLLKARTVEEGVEEMKGIVAELQGRGITINLNNNGFMKMRAPRERKRMDIFPVIQVSDSKVHMHMQSLRMRDVPRDAVLPFREIEFYGQTFKGPARAAEFLEERYGKTWSTPLRQVGAKTVLATPAGGEVPEGVTAADVGGADEEPAEA